MITVATNPMVVVGVDPGLTTGIATWTQAHGMHGLKELAPALNAMDWLDCLTRTGHKKVFVIEKYIITPKTAQLSQQHDPLEIIGCLRWMCHDRGHEFVMQSPSEAKAFSTDAKLKAVGWYQPGQGHARDASRHALLYLAKNGFIDLATLKGDKSAGL